MPPRGRVAFRVADEVSARVQDAAAELVLTPSRRTVLSAVLRLLCGWSRVADDRVRLGQVVELTRTASSAPLVAKTVARALGDLTAAEIIVYTPAVGRGRFATVALHPRFLDGVDQLERDETGRVVPLSAPSPSISKTKNPLPPSGHRRGRRENPGGRSSATTKNTSTSQVAPGTRPTSVPVHRDDVATVLSGLDPVYLAVPPRVRTALIREIRRQLGRGWGPAEVGAALGGALPEQVLRPLLLARWRFAMNLRCAGPRLERLQRAWDQAEARVAHELAVQHRQDLAERNAMAATFDEALRARLTERLGHPYLPAAVAVRMAMSAAQQAYPQLTAVAAARRWVSA